MSEFIEIARKQIGLSDEIIKRMINEGEGVIEIDEKRFHFDCWSLDEFYLEFDLGFDIYFDDWSYGDLYNVVNEIMVDEDYIFWSIIEYGMDIYIIGLKM